MKELVAGEGRIKSELRTHPKLRYKGSSSWPPMWGGTYGPADSFPLEEEGILEDVELVEGDFIGPRRLELLQSYRGRKSSGQIWVDDQSVIPPLFKVLRRMIGHPIREVGNLVVDL